MGLPCATLHDDFHALTGPFPEAALPHRPALFSFFSGGFGLDLLIFWSQPVGVSSSEAFQHAPLFRAS